MQGYSQSSPPLSPKNLIPQKIRSFASSPFGSTSPKKGKDDLDDGISLSNKATLIVATLVMATFSLASLFLEAYVVTANAAIVVFVVGSYVVWSSYHSFHYYLSKYSKSYSAITDQEKQFYVLSNLIKSSVLLVYSPLAAVLLYNCLVHDQWDSTRIRIMGTLYTIPDFVSLFMVRRMATTTIVHHVVVCIFNCFSVYNDYNDVNVIRAIVVYAIFSTFAYLVNLLLAARFMDTSFVLKAVLSALALVIYALCCAVNWVWQLFFLSKLVYSQMIPVAIYSGLVLLLVWDDVVLLKWLWSNVKNAMNMKKEN